jgi:hypothetical protein
MLQGAGLKTRVLEFDLNVDSGIYDAHEQSVTFLTRFLVMRRRGTAGVRVHCVCDEVAEHGADHGGVGDVGEHAVARNTYIQQQLLRKLVSCGLRGGGGGGGGGAAAGCARCSCRSRSRMC